MAADMGVPPSMEELIRLVEPSDLESRQIRGHTVAGKKREGWVIMKRLGSIAACLLIGLLIGCTNEIDTSSRNESDRELAFVDEAIHLINDVTDAGCVDVHCAFPDQADYFSDVFNDLKIGTCSYSCILVEFSRSPGECFGFGEILFLDEVNHHCTPSF